MPTGKDAVVVMFSREQVRQRKLNHFLKRFGSAALPEGSALAKMMERAGMSEMDIYNRTRDIFLHYGLPYDALPPED